jgi:hypothetical protein
LWFKAEMKVDATTHWSSDLRAALQRHSEAARSLHPRLGSPPPLPLDRGTRTSFGTRFLVLAESATIVRPKTSKNYQCCKWSSTCRLADR